jgi:hypothetical protein
MTRRNEFADRMMNLLYPSRKNPVNRAKRVAEHVLGDLKNGIWPNGEDEGDIERAKSLQRKVILTGGVAVFAYIFSRSNKETLDRLQERTFKVGAVSSDNRVAEMAGKFVAKKRKFLGGSKFVHIETEADIPEEALELIEQGVNKLDSHEDN